MKFPSLVKLPKNRQFKYKPRHYDPVLDNLNERVEQIKREMGEENLKEGTSYRPRISFRNSNLRKSNMQSMVIRLVLIAVFLLDFFGYLYFGWGKALQLTILGEILGFYLWFRIFKRRTKKND